jgi:hypothetical protein
MKTQIKEVVYRDDSIENRKNFFEYLTHFNRKKMEPKIGVFRRYNLVQKN